MKLNNRWFLGTLVGLMLLLLTGLFVLVSSSGTKAESSHPLYTISINSSDAQIAKAATDYTVGEHAVLTGTPQVVLNRRVTVASLEQFGFGTIAMPVNPPPLQLVILKGDFDASGVLPGMTTQLSAEYIGYVFDLYAGSLNSVRVSPHGGIFRVALNNPNLPDDYPAAPANEQITESKALAPTASSIVPFPNGAVVPGINMTTVTPKK
jgi:hypothetical protein